MFSITCVAITPLLDNFPPFRHETLNGQLVGDNFIRKLLFSQLPNLAAKGTLNKNWREGNHHVSFTHMCQEGEKFTRLAYISETVSAYLQIRLKSADSYIGVACVGMAWAVLDQ